MSRPRWNQLRSTLILSLAALLCAVPRVSALVAQDEAAAEAADPAAETADPAANADGSPPPETVLPKLEELEPPPLEALLNGPARDWIVLNTQHVVVTELIVPRPDTLARLEAAYKDKEKERRGKTGVDLERWKKELEDLRYVFVSLPGPPAQEFRIARARIERIVYHEDFILQKIDSLLAEKNIEVANELLVRFERQWPDWPGLVDRRLTLIFTDASLRLEAGDPEACLVLCEELHEQKADFPGLSELTGQAAEQLVTTAQQANDPARARHFLIRLDKLFTQHPVFERLSAVYAAQATELMNQASAASKAGQHPEAASLAEQAVAFWPRLVSLKPGHKVATERFQRLRVGVVRLPGTPKATPFDGEAEVRGKRLSQYRLFEVDDFRGGIPHYRTSYLDEWEPFDLGRRMRFTLTQTRQPWEAQPPLDSEAMTLAIKSQLDPASPTYDERLASYVESVTADSPFEFTLRFSRVPARIEPVLRHASQSLPSLIAPPAAPTTEIQSVAFVEAAENAGDFTGGFPIVSSDERQTVYRRLRTEPDGLPRYHVAEVIEQLYENHEKAYQALLQGEVWMIPDLPDWIVRRAQADRKLEKDFFIQKYAVPTTHVLQFNPKSRPLAFRELRRALLHAIDRERLLNEIVLRDKALLADIAERDRLLKERGPAEPRVQQLEKSIRDHKLLAHGRIVNTPFPSFSYANSPNLLPQGLDLSASVAMAIAVTSQMGGEIPPLRLAVPPEPIPQAIAKRLLTAWRRVGINVVPVEAGSADAAGWDIAYRTIQLDEPIVELWPFLTVQDRANLNDLNPFPDWLKQELIALDRTADWNRAVELVQTLHRHLWADVRFIPLWELDGYVIYRKTLRGVPTDPLHCYEQLDRWNLEAWYATETP